MSFFVPDRRPSEEFLDKPDLPADEMGRSLEDLEFVNRFWGNARALEKHLAADLKESARGGTTILDIGAGSGGMSRDLERGLRKRGFSARVVAVDAQWRHLAFGRRESPDGMAAAAADAFALPFADRSVDWIFSTLFFHHLSPEENDSLLREASRVARRGFAILDIRRHWFPLLFIAAVGRFTLKSAVSASDGVASVRQSYTPEEALRIASRASPGAGVERVFPFRLLIHRP